MKEEQDFPGTSLTVIPWSWIVLIVLAFALILLSGCASMDYQWHRVHDPAPAPWLYVNVADPDAVCKQLGASGSGLSRIVACAQWTAAGCIVFLPIDAPAWVKEHEDKHCQGYSHD